MDNATGTFTLVQLTDTHLLPAPAALHGRLNTWQRTIDVLGAAAHFAPDAVLVTGDIAHSGSDIQLPASRLFDRAAEQLECPVIVLPGNHDPAPHFPEPFNRLRTAVGPAAGDTVHHVRGLRIIGLDSRSEGAPHGELSAAQLAWLSRTLSQPSPHGTILALHHPPIDPLLPQLAGRGLSTPDTLLSALRGTDVRGILAGHYHHALAGTLGTIPVWVGPAVAYNQNLFAPPGSVQGIDSTWLSVIQLRPGAFTATPVPVSAGTPVFTSTVSQPAAEDLASVQGEIHA